MPCTVVKVEDMADQKINLKIGNKTYGLNASSPEKEQLMRLAAEDVNSHLKSFRLKYPSVTDEDILSLVALNEAMAALSSTKQLEIAKKAEKSLFEEIDSYLSDIEKK